MDNDKQTLLVEVEYDKYNTPEGVLSEINGKQDEQGFYANDATDRYISRQRVAEVLDHCKDFRDFDYNKGWNAALEMVRDILLPAPPATPEPRP